MASKGVKAWSVIPFNPRFVRDGVITDPKAFSQVILNAIDRPGLRLFRALGALSGQRSIVSTLTLPKVGDISLNELIPREARRSLGVAIDSYYLHWRLLRKEASRQVFYLVAVPRDSVDRFAESMR
ncbi:MAG: hypothetical protein HY666_04990, partial [Chloroflexi bacterium]|nr:hypothetical protein [Chloroflexota bacterium]